MRPDGRCENVACGGVRSIEACLGSVGEMLCIVFVRDLVTISFILVCPSLSVGPNVTAPLMGNSRKPLAPGVRGVGIVSYGIVPCKQELNNIVPYLSQEITM